jgi:SAM-dependent methyltransferase
MKDFEGKRVLDAGCGHGHHLLMVAPFIKEGIGVDLNTAQIAAEETSHVKNISIMEGDIALVDFPEPFDVVYCVGVIQHTDHPDKTFANLKRLTKKGGTLIIWAYSHEGNFLNRTFLEWIKQLLINHLPSDVNLALAVIITVILYPFIWSIYLLPLKKVLPFYDYFAIFRRLPFLKNMQLQERVCLRTKQKRIRRPVWRCVRFQG